MSSKWEVHTGNPSWHQRRAGHLSAGADVFASRDDAESFAAKYRAAHPGEVCFVRERQSEFTCIDCKASKPILTDGGTGYACVENGKVCYACCAIRDAAEMAERGKITLYHHADGRVTNWPGTLEFMTAFVKKGRHIVAGQHLTQRKTVYFRVNKTTDAGNQVEYWSGVNIGDNDILRCRRISRRAWNNA